MPGRQCLNTEGRLCRQVDTSRRDGPEEEETPELGLPRVRQRKADLADSEGVLGPSGHFDGDPLNLVVAALVTVLERVQHLSVPLVVELSCVGGRPNFCQDQNGYGEWRNGAYQQCWCTKPRHSAGAVAGARAVPDLVTGLYSQTQLYALAMEASILTTDSW